ncbi:MAG: tetratricopeptide repeat protein, partial [Salinibacter sp.]
MAGPLLCGLRVSRPSGGSALALSILLGALLIVGPPRTQAQTNDSTQAQRLQRAESLLQSDQPGEAIPILESVYERDPTQTVVFQRLKEAYQENKQYTAAVELLNDRIDERPTPALLTEKARLLYQDGQEDRALEVWREALDLQPEEISTYRRVYRMLVDLREYGPAIDVLTRARSALDRPSVFRTDLARLYNRDGQHEKAMQEYVSLLADSPDRLNYVKEQLQPFVERGEGVSAGIEVLESAVGSSSPTKAYRQLLGWLHMETGDYSAAFDVYKAVDQDQEQPGQGLLSFARAAATAEEYALATRAYETIVDRRPDGPLAPPARKEMGDTYRRWAAQEADSMALVDTTGAQGRRYAAARTAYRTFLKRHPEHESALAVRTELGTLQLEVFRNLDAAASAFQTISEKAPDASQSQRARFNLGRVALLRDSLDRADQIFSDLSESADRDALALRAQFERARLQFYQGNFDTALTEVKDIAPNTSSDVANDAIDLKVLLQEGRGPDSLDTALRLYADAQ